MPWWVWVLFWIVFWTVAVAYLVRCCWRVWPHATGFAQACSQAWERLDQARDAAADVTASRELTRPGDASANPSPDSDEPLAWERPASYWRRRYAADKHVQAEQKLSDHAAVWREWTHPVD